MFDYNKLFAEGNIIGLKNKDIDYVFVHRVLPDSIKKWFKNATDVIVNWDEYKNERLAFFDMEVSWIARYDEENCSLDVIFNRDKDMPLPEIKDGMKIWVQTDYDNEPHIGIVVNDKVFYKSGGFDYLKGDYSVENHIIAIYNHERGFDYRNAKPIWGKDMISYL